MDLQLCLLNSFLESVTDLNVTFSNAVIKLLLSVVLGMMIGAERKRKGQVAGMRTFALISMGACMAMLISIYVPQEYLGLKNGDPGRIAAQVITGVGFLGGGAMIHLRGAVKGLTTAAGIWMVSIVGMGVGVGMYGASIVATLLSLFVLQAFEWYEHKRNLGQESRVITVKVKSIVNDITPYRDILEKAGIHLSTFFITYDYGAGTTEISFMVLSPSYVDLLKVIPQIKSVGETQSLTLANQS